MATQVGLDSFLFRFRRSIQAMPNISRCFVFPPILRRNRKRKLLMLISVCCMIFYVGPFLLGEHFDHVHSSIHHRETSSRNRPVNLDSGAHGKSEPAVHGDGKLSSGHSPHVTFAGILNLYEWNLCGHTVESLRQYPFFPCLPDNQTLITSFHALTPKATAQRIFGYLIPPVAGKYRFLLISTYGSELWLSTSEDPRKVRLIAAVGHNSTRLRVDGHYTNAPANMSKEIKLKGNQKYFVEAMHNAIGPRSIFVLWEHPGTERFVTITEQFLSSHCPGNHQQDCGCITDKLRDSLDIPSHAAPTASPQLTDEEVQHFYRTTDFSQENLRGVLKFVPYSPTYLVKRGYVPQYGGVRIANKHWTSVYPRDDTRITKKSESEASRKWAPNVVLNRALVEGVVAQFMSALARKHRE